jgi:TetR/AcrR family transcriptional repressor of nem operon
MGTRERIVEAARYLFWDRGYAATGLNDILRRAKARSGSFYHFFRSKRDLLNAVLDTYVDALQPVVIEPAVRAGADGIARVFAVLDGYRQSLLGTSCTYGCPIGRLALEIDPANEASMKLIAKNFGEWANAVEHLLRQETERFPPSTDLGQLAQFVLTVMEGGVMQARAHRSIAPFDASVRHLREYLNLLAAIAPPRQTPAITSKRRPIQRNASGEPRQLP